MMFFSKPIDITRFYIKSKNRATFTLLFCLILALGLSFGTFYVIGGAAGLSSITGMDKISTGLDQDWMKWTVGSIVGIVCFFGWVGFIKKARLVRLLRKSLKLAKLEGADATSTFIKERLLYVWIQKNNSFWIWSFVMGILFLCFFYTSMIGLYGLAGGSADNIFTCFKADSGIKKAFSGSATDVKPADWVWIVSVISFWVILIFTVITQQIKMSKINEIWTMCGKDDEDMLFWNQQVVIPRLLRNNKRNKLFIYVTFCVLGFPIFFFLKRAMSTIYRTNINNPRD